MASTVTRAGRARKLLFSIFYSTSYTAVFFLVVCLAVVVPADVVYQAYKSTRLIDIFVLAGVYVLTALIAILIYTSRLYTNRSVVKSIPKTYIPIEREDLPGKRIRKLIANSLVRSAVIAFEARPKSDTRREARLPTASARISALTSSSTKKVDNVAPSWGHIEHPGWSSPASPDLPNLQYATVIAELADLIEARAVSLAPSDPLATPNVDGTPIPDERVVDILQRPVDMGLRQYISQLVGLHVITDPSLANEFLILYERARFAADPITELEFRALMSIFAEILRSMTGLDPELVAELGLQQDADYEDSSILDADDHSDDDRSFYETGSVRRFNIDNGNHDSGGPPPRVSEDSARSSTTSADKYHDHKKTQRTAPSTSRPTMPSSSRKVSANSGYALRQTRSTTSVASKGSSHSGGSVIRLAHPGEEPPYTIHMPYSMLVRDDN